MVKVIVSIKAIKEKAYFRSQILECEYRAIMEHICLTVLLAIRQYCHILDLIKITEFGNTTAISVPVFFKTGTFQYRGLQVYFFCTEYLLTVCQCMNCLTFVSLSLLSSWKERLIRWEFIQIFIF